MSFSESESAEQNVILREINIYHYNILDSLFIVRRTDKDSGYFIAGEINEPVSGK